MSFRELDPELRQLQRLRWRLAGRILLDSGKNSVQAACEKWAPDQRWFVRFAASFDRGISPKPNQMGMTDLAPGRRETAFGLASQDVQMPGSPNRAISGSC